MLFYGLDPTRFVNELKKVFMAKRGLVKAGRDKGIRQEREDEDKAKSRRL